MGNLTRPTEAPNPQGLGPKTAKNRLHLDLQVSGGRHHSAGGVDHVTMADPEGNEFCVV